MSGTPSRIRAEQVTPGPLSKFRTTRAKAMSGGFQRLRLALAVKLDAGKRRPVPYTLDPSILVYCSDADAVAFVRKEFRAMVTRLRQYNGRDTSTT